MPNVGEDVEKGQGMEEGCVNLSKHPAGPVSTLGQVQTGQSSSPPLLGLSERPPAAAAAAAAAWKLVRNTDSRPLPQTNWKQAKTKPTPLAGCQQWAFSPALPVSLMGAEI